MNLQQTAQHVAAANILILHGPPPLHRAPNAPSIPTVAPTVASLPVLHAANPIPTTNPQPGNPAPVIPAAVTPPPLTDLKFYPGRKGGQQCSYNGYSFTYDKRNNDNRYWACKDRKCYTPPCKGRLTTNGTTVVKSSTHCHPGSSTEVAAEIFIADLRSAPTASSDAKTPKPSGRSCLHLLLLSRPSCRQSTT